jgi:hypothetical protein
MRILKTILLTGLSTLCFSQAFATPLSMTTHNKTNVDSNAYIGGIPSIYPAKANSDRTISWSLVRLACFGHGDPCKAEVFMETNTSNPVSIGFMSMNLKTGDITPKKSGKNGYCVTVNGPAEVTLTKENC